MRPSRESSSLGRVPVGVLCSVGLGARAGRGRGNRRCCRNGRGGVGPLGLTPFTVAWFSLLIDNQRVGCEMVLLRRTVEQSALPFGVARLDMELEALGLKSGKERFLGGGHFGEVRCLG